MASVDELNAGFDALSGALHKIVGQLVPGFLQPAAIEHLENQQGRELILEGVKDVLEAAEKVRVKDVLEAAEKRAKA